MCGDEFGKKSAILKSVFVWNFDKNLNQNHILKLFLHIIINEIFKSYRRICKNKNNNKTHSEMFSLQ